MHAALKRQGHCVGTEQTRRVMKLAQVKGVNRAKSIFTTRTDQSLAKPVDLVNRDFTAAAPNRLWVVDIT